MNKNEQIVKSLHKEGLNDSQINAISGIYRSTVGKIRKKLDLESNGSKYVPLYSKLKELYLDNLTDSEIAKKLDISDKAVFYIRKQLDLKTKFKVKKYYNSIDKRKGYWLRNIRNSAMQRNLDYNLQIEDFDLPEFCPLLGTKLNYNGKPNDPYNASIDRIDNTKGYIKGNVIVISRKANQMKNSGTLDELLTFASNINILVNYYKDQGALGDITDVFPNIVLCKEI